VFGANWIVHVDADEFLWPEHDDDLKTPLMRVPADVEGILVPRSNFVAVSDPDRPAPFYSRMQVRERRSTNPDGDELPGKVAHRASPDVAVDQGNHGFTINGRYPKILRSDDFVIFHFPMRGYGRFKKKIASGGAAYARNTRLPESVGGTWRRLYKRHMAGELEAWYESQLLGVEQLRRAMVAGDLLLDSRLGEYMTKHVAPHQRQREATRRSASGER
jgi:hypothetical protein